jgi:hypothetical protein
VLIETPIMLWALVLASNFIVQMIPSEPTLLYQLGDACLPNDAKGTFQQ